MDLIDRSEAQYKMLKILPESDSLDWYEQAKPEEVKDLVDEMYSLHLAFSTLLSESEPESSDRKRKSA